MEKYLEEFVATVKPLVGLQGEPAKISGGPAIVSGSIQGATHQGWWSNR
jgi:hypothetical protein